MWRKSWPAVFQKQNPEKNSSGELQSNICTINLRTAFSLAAPKPEKSNLLHFVWWKYWEKARVWRFGRQSQLIPYFLHRKRGIPLLEALSHRVSTAVIYYLSLICWMNLHEFLASLDRDVCSMGKPGLEVQAFSITLNVIRYGIGFEGAMMAVLLQYWFGKVYL